MKPLQEFLDDCEPNGGKHPLIEVEPRKAGVEYEPFILIRAGKHAAIVRPLTVHQEDGTSYLDLDIHSFVDGEGATGGVFGMTVGRRHKFDDTGHTSQGWPSAALVAVLVGDQADTPPVGREARCGKCDETFNPAGPDDLIHIQMLDGTECGGDGVLVGEWR